MGRAVFLACLPWIACLLASVCVAFVLIRLNRERPSLRRLLRLHRDEVGAVQSLSFVLTLPIFMMVMMFIVQVSQLMIGTVIVHYAAFAAARAAIVWVPADLGGEEGGNRISAYMIDPEATDQVMPQLDSTATDYGPGSGGVTFVISPGSVKYDKIATAALLAIMPICPSRDVGAKGGPATAGLSGLVKDAYRSLSPQSVNNSRVPTRLDNKLAYAYDATRIEVRFFHKNSEPPLVTYLKPDGDRFPPDGVGEFFYNEVGWQDPITVTVKHQFAMLPGPGRLLSKFTSASAWQEKGSGGASGPFPVYTYPLQATITLGNEGLQSVVPYVYQN